MTIYEQCRKYSDDTLGRFREQLGSVPLEDDVVLTCGSYARRDASRNSDVDFFVLSNRQDADSALVQEITAGIEKVVPHVPARGGAFGQIERSADMLRNIGGNNDDNKNITRRILFLLEGEWLFNENGLRDLRRQILERYIADGMTDHQLALFLLNDIIRYYRTIAVDYEFKTVEDDPPKPWAIRNIKLIFSRKFLYASGLFSIAMTIDRSRERKIDLLEELFDLPVVDRMLRICGESGMTSVLESYDVYLEHMQDPNIREHLEQLKESERQDLIFRRIKNEGHHFTRELLKLFENTFDSTHPIRRAVLF